MGFRRWPLGRWLLISAKLGLAGFPAPVPWYFTAVVFHCRGISQPLYLAVVVFRSRCISQWLYFAVVIFLCHCVAAVLSGRRLNGPVSQCLAQVL